MIAIKAFKGVFMEIKKYKVAVIGGGASGLVCALRCAEKLGPDSTVILEKNKKCGRKLLATGNGRCNISNRNIEAARYHGDKKLIDEVLPCFTLRDSECFFRQLGIIFRYDDEGRAYPYSNRAETVLDMLRLKAQTLGVQEICEYNIKKIFKSHGLFNILSDSETVTAEYVVFAVGSGASFPLGSEDGLNLIKSLGLKPTPIFPSLSPVSVKEKCNILKGIRARGTVSVKTGDKILTDSCGEVQFNDRSISGICVFEVSRVINEYLYFGTVSGKTVGNLNLCVDVMPSFSINGLCKYLTECREIFRDQVAGLILSAALNKKLSQYIVEACRLQNKHSDALTEKEIKLIAHTAKSLTFTPKIGDGLKSAQVCAGGFGCNEVDPHTLMSRKIKNLFIIGEALNVDGDCGGFNLHFAFGSAMIPVKSIN